jgi:hypothetical protein
VTVCLKRWFSSGLLFIGCCVLCSLAKGRRYYDSADMFDQKMAMNMKIKQQKAAAAAGN